jgi:adenylosuccinate lyase
MQESIGNVLAERYASEKMREIWSPSGKVIAERRLWLAVLQSQAKLGMDVPADAIAAYKAQIENVDLRSIAEREAVLRHDVKARIEEFNALAGYQLVHTGMTSRDLTDNVEQVQIYESMCVISFKTAALLSRFTRKAGEHRDTFVCGRTHNVPAQTTTLGKRFAMWTEELMAAVRHLEGIIASYPLRGIKGPVGTQQDMVTLLGPEGAKALEGTVQRHLAFGRALTSVGQVYPRSLDFMVVSALAQLASAPANFATTMRLMAGQSQVTEGFKQGQTGSSAMPHKMNMRTCERVCGLLNVLTGHVAMAAGLLGQQWYEGDVSCSVTRRVVLPDACFALDGLLEAALTVLDEMGVFTSVIERELAAELPFLSTTGLLMEAVGRGMGREDAHACIKKHSTETLVRIRSGGSGDVFAELLGDDPAFPLTADEIRALMVPDAGLAGEQYEAIRQEVASILKEYPHAASYQPAPIL